MIRLNTVSSIPPLIFTGDEKYEIWPLTGSGTEKQRIGNLLSAFDEPTISTKFGGYYRRIHQVRSAHPWQIAVTELPPEKCSWKTWLVVNNSAVDCRIFLKLTLNSYKTEFRHIGLKQQLAILNTCSRRKTVTADWLRQFGSGSPYNTLYLQPYAATQ